MANLRNLPLSDRPVRRLAALFAGLVLYGVAASLMIAGRLGLDPWDVFHQGVSRLTGLDFGTVMIVTGVFVLLLWIPLRQMPGIGTISNAVVIGLSANATTTVLPIPHHLAARWAYGLGGIVLLAASTALYIGARLGPGPRDGLMTGIILRFPGRRFVSIRVVRTAIEISVLAAGWLMGGTVGWITLIFAATIGPLTHILIPVFTFPDPSMIPGSRTLSLPERRSDNENVHDLGIVDVSPRGGS